MKVFKKVLCGILTVFAFAFMVNAQTVEMTANELVGTASNGVITLDKDITLTSTINITDESIKEINLNGFSIVGTSTVDPMFKINGGSLAVTGNGTITSENDSFALYGNETVGESAIKAEVTIGADVRVISNTTNCIYIRGNGAKADVYGYLEAKGDYSVIQGNGTKKTTQDAGNTVINIYDGATVINTFKYVGNLVNPAIYHPQSGTLTIHGGTIQGVTGIEMRAGDLVVEGGTIIGTLEETVTKANNNGPAVMGAGIAIAQHTTMQDVSISVTGNSTIKGATALYENTLETPNNPIVVELDVQSGNFVSDLKTPVYSYNKKSFISGGTFNADVTEYIADGLFVRVDGTNYIVEEPTSIPTVDVIDPNEEVTDVTIGVIEDEEVSNILLDSLANDAAASKIVEESGVSVNISVDIDEIDEENVPAEEKEVIEAIKEKADKATIVNFFDITVAIKNANTSAEITTLSNLSKEIELMVLLPENLKTVDKNVNRKYFIIREHDGEIDLIDAQLSDDGKYLMFKTNKFSTYALAYQDSTQDIENPQTYDGVHIQMILFVASLLTLVSATIFIKKKNIFG